MTTTWQIHRKCTSKLMTLLSCILWVQVCAQLRPLMETKSVLHHTFKVWIKRAKMVLKLREDRCSNWNRWPSKKRRRKRRKEIHRHSSSRPPRWVTRPKNRTLSAVVSISHLKELKSRRISNHCRIISSRPRSSAQVKPTSDSTAVQVIHPI